MRGFSDENGSWNTNWTARLKAVRSSSASLWTSRGPEPSSKQTVPLSGWIARMMILETVVLPQPDSPTRPRVLPAGKDRATPLPAWMVRVLHMNQPERRVKVLHSPSAFSTEPFGGGGFGSFLRRARVALLTSRIGVKRSFGPIEKRGTA